MDSIISNIENFLEYFCPAFLSIGDVCLPFLKRSSFFAIVLALIFYLLYIKFFYNKIKIYRPKDTLNFDEPYRNSIKYLFWGHFLFFTCYGIYLLEEKNFSSVSYIIGATLGWAIFAIVIFIGFTFIWVPDVVRGIPRYVFKTLLRRN